MTESELKPCPFCNHEASMQRINSINPNNPPLYKAICFSCMATITRLKRHEAVEAWNKRHQDEKFKKAIEFIEKVSKTKRDSDYLPPEMSIYCEHVDDAYDLLRELGES